MSTLASTTMARLIATSCCTAIEWAPSDEAGSMSSPIVARCSAARRRVRGQSMAPRRRGSLPSMMFSATVRFSQRLTSWYTVAIPAAWASPGPENRCGSPSTRISPESMP